MKLSTLTARRDCYNTKKTLLVSFLVLGVLLISTTLFSQTSTTIVYTGGPQNVTVPPCTSTLSISLSGSSGGGPNGGAGANLDLNIPVQPGDVVTFVIGQASTGQAGGYPNGGNGAGASTAGYFSYGGGGSSMVYVNGVLVAVAGAGGGGGGGNTAAAAANGGCATGAGTAVSPFGSGGGNGTQTAGGAAGPPWIATGNAGQAGSYLQGGNGAVDPCFNVGPGGGGGGGYYGGGGGGSDCFGSGTLGGGAGGGGSSLIPAGTPCVDDTVVGDGSAVINTNLGVVATNTGPFCEGSLIQFNSSNGGTAYNWTGPNGFTSTLQNPTIPNAALSDTGLYGVIVTGTGCLDTAYTTVSVSPAIFPNAGIDDTVCFGSSFPLVGTFTTPGDSAMWTYYAPNLSQTPLVTYLPAADSLNTTVGVTVPGTYNFILTETNPVCGSVSDTVVIFVKQMDVQTVFSDPSCFGVSDGTINATGTDATEFSFDGGTTWGTTQATGLPAGIYSVCARDVNQCQACMQVTLTDPPAVILSTSNDTLICENGTATLIASAINGNAFVYNWTQFSTTGDTQYGSPAVDTYYTVQAMSGNGCFSNTDSIFVTVRPPISGTISPDASICPGYNTLQTVTALDGIGAPYTFTWSDGTIGTGPSHSYMVSPPVTQPYSVTITDACESTPLTLTNTITVDPIPVPSFISDAPELCEPAEFEVYVTTNPADYVTASWLLSDGQFYMNTDTIQTSPMMEGSYSGQLVLTNQFGCIDSVTMANYLVSHPLPISKFKFYPGAPTMFATDVQFTNFSVNTASSAWTFESGDPATSADMDPETTFPEGEVGFYDVELIVTSDFGCLDTSMQTVEVKPEVLLYAPNTFTPDGDEFNPNWRVHIVGIDVQEFQLEIRNRWGELIWESHDVDAEWDGSYHNEQVPNGAYNWFIRAKDIVTDEPYIFKGHVNVMK